MHRRALFRVAGILEIETGSRFSTKNSASRTLSAEKTRRGVGFEGSDLGQITGKRQKEPRQSPAENPPRKDNRNQEFFGTRFFYYHDFKPDFQSSEVIGITTLTENAKLYTYGNPQCR